MEAIILAGGFGTRLRQVVSDVPKPMAPMDDKGTPFLTFILNDLYKAGFSHVVLAVGYMHEVIIRYYGDNYKGMRLSYSIEDKPLLTGGAIRQAMNSCHENRVFVLNGDTYFQVDYNKMVDYCKQKNVDILLSLKEMNDFDRYGTVEEKSGRIISFNEKKFSHHGLINGGVYYMNRSLLKDENKKFSFEEYLSLNIELLEIYGIKDRGFFVDIGIPSDYNTAKKYFSAYEEMS
ncbi:MAG: nucleotidyltransferase family protein [Selenomonas sp.]|uniref:nucleotidyltransferase family protein n=1 Tax=Selenomonas sp. TaxID=2053611 RepID=UPI0025E64991|nr:nucleotidyltransferase family protein [Selenomonas sp.]MCR5438566.1 nucleotidyltransferase family protein [Selenomonas sp.]